MTFGGVCHPEFFAIVILSNAKDLSDMSDYLRGKFSYGA